MAKNSHIVMSENDGKELYPIPKLVYNIYKVSVLQMEALNAQSIDQIRECENNSSFSAINNPEETMIRKEK